MELRDEYCYCQVVIYDGCVIFCDGIYEVEDVESVFGVGFLKFWQEFDQSRYYFCFDCYYVVVVVFV